MNRVFQLYNRYKDDVQLRQIGETCEYQLYIKEDDSDGYWSASYDTNPDGSIAYFSVDPSGGPYLHLGECRVDVYLECTYVMSITKIEFRDKHFVLTIPKIEIPD